MAVEDPGMPCSRRGPGDELVASPVAPGTAPLAKFGDEVRPLLHDVEVPPPGFHLCVTSGEHGLWVYTAPGIGISVPPHEDIDGVFFPVDSGPQDDSPLNIEKEPEQWSERAHGASHLWIRDPQQDGVHAPFFYPRDQAFRVRDSWRDFLYKSYPYEENKSYPYEEKF
jgi:hypothetical protein